ncbi:alpha/beta hydrolase fold domain-containing protein [Nocardia sp. NPDC051787]|uniref:alpha/beta hydrolase family protein n=1 Tax=Nocardia sp. NPDC051787 TaxID=3155415 RepID=UPI0034284E9D
MTTVTIPYGPQPSQVADLSMPETAGPHPVAVLVHGGFWKATYDRSYFAPLVWDLVGRGYAVWNLEYRRLGEPGGGWPGTLLDAAAAVDLLALMTVQAGSWRLPEGTRLDLTRVVTVGHSAGGQLALWLAARTRLPLPIGGPPRTPIACAVALAGVLDLHTADMQRLGATEADPVTSASLCPAGAVAALLGGHADEVPERYHLSSPHYLLPLGLSVILVHGGADQDVPIQQSRTYAAAARAAGDSVELIESSDAGHFDVVDTRGPEWCAAMDRLWGQLC